MKTFGGARFVRSAHAAATSMVGEQMLTEIIATTALNTDAAILLRRHCVSVKSRGASHLNRAIWFKVCLPFPAQ
jgi:hypothetical protein